MQRLPNKRLEKNIRKLKEEERRERDNGGDYLIYMNMARDLERIKNIFDRKINNENYEIRIDIWNHYLLLMRKAEKLRGEESSNRHGRI